MPYHILPADRAEAHAFYTATLERLLREQRQANDDTGTYGAEDAARDARLSTERVYGQYTPPTSLEVLKPVLIISIIVFGLVLLVAVCVNA